MVNFFKNVAFDDSASVMIENMWILTKLVVRKVELID